ncbi:MAG: pseudouridine-5'-phosphate glycosidase [Trueperaceae bacterium]|nr:MAG: pseudouridine-5'-phosphate glycosidase [Trueperaceae bacterium]
MIRVGPAVQSALARGEPVVALESTVLTHGLPRPDNLALGRRLEEIVRAGGAVPATVAVVAGELTVGIDDEAMQRLAERDAAKASLWNLASVVASGSDAGTTVATTLFAAARAGIAVFATGGLGGVHREAFDESADLTALARESVVTVCAGPKSVLDAAATLERLETSGVAVAGWRSEHLAGFLTPHTDLVVPTRCDDVEQVATLFHVQRDLGLPGGLVLSRPEPDGLEPAALAALLDAALADADTAGVRGKDVTPHLLRRLAERSDGATVHVNLRLLEGNAALAAEIAVAIARQRAFRAASTSPNEVPV